MQGEGNRPKQRAQEWVEDRGARVHDTDPAPPDRVAACRCPPPAVPSRHAALTAALHQRVAQRAARELRASTQLVGHICEHCLDAPAVLVQPAPWGGEMGVCAACHSHRPRTTRRLRPDDPRLGLCQGWSRAAPEAGGDLCWPRSGRAVHHAARALLLASCPAQTPRAHIPER
jgi:hypothetical protein